MAVENFIQSIWSKKIQDDLELICKLVANCLRTYEGDCKYAQSVKILGVGEPTISDYDKNQKLTYEEMSDRGQILTIDKAKSFSFLVDDIDQAQSVPGLAEEYRRKAVHGLAVARDSYVAELIASGANVTEVAGVTQEAVKAGIDKAIVALRERNFDEDGVIEITPAVYNVFKNELITLSTNNPEYIKRGIVGMYDGFDVVMSNNLKNDGTNVYCDIRGRKAIAFAAQIEKVEAGRSENYFKDYVRGLDVYGSKVIDDERLQVLKIAV